MTLEFHVPDMKNCEHCVRAITQGVHHVAPDAEVSVDLAAQPVSVPHADDADAVRQAIAAAGYSLAWM